MHVAEPGSQSKLCSSTARGTELLPVQQQLVVWLLCLGRGDWDRDGPAGLDTLLCALLSQCLRRSFCFSLRLVLLVRPATSVLWASFTSLHQFLRAPHGSSAQ